MTKDTWYSARNGTSRTVASLNSDYLARMLGQGQFGKVVEAVHFKHRYALKIVKAVDKYTHAARNEIEILKLLQRNDPDCLKRCIRLQDSFVHNNHVCMVFELMGKSLFDYMKDTAFAPLPLWQIRNLGRQLLTAVSFMHQLGLIHTDLKPGTIR
jgi:dual-specificity kinase